MGSASDGAVFRVLGPLEVVVDGRAVVLGSPKVRLLLAALLADANTVVSTDRLVEALWGERPPESALSALQKLVHRLRSLVRSAHRPDADVLVTRAPGYVLKVDPGCYDAAQFEELVVDAQHGAQRGDPGAALAALDAALALWRGPALAEFAFEEFARAEATRLEELRVVAVEERVEAKLQLGRHDEVTGELDALVAEFPYREGLWAQLMLALYRSGRQADALRAYGHVRTQLAEELGIEHMLVSRLVIENGRFTGDVHRPICYGAGKIHWARRFAEEHGVDLGASWFYTDSVTDLPMLEIVGHPEIVNPDPRLRREARKRGWNVTHIRVDDPSPETN